MKKLLQAILTTRSGIIVFMYEVMTLEATPAYAKYRNQSNFWKNSMFFPRGPAVILSQFGAVTAPDRCRRCNLPYFDLLATMYRTARKEAVGERHVTGGTRGPASYGIG